MKSRRVRAPANCRICRGLHDFDAQQHGKANVARAPSAGAVESAADLAGRGKIGRTIEEPLIPVLGRSRRSRAYARVALRLHNMPASLKE